MGGDIQTDVFPADDLAAAPAPITTDDAGARSRRGRRTASTSASSARAAASDGSASSTPRRASRRSSTRSPSLGAGGADAADARLPGDLGRALARRRASDQRAGHDLRPGLPRPASSAARREARSSSRRRSRSAARSASSSRAWSASASCSAAPRRGCAWSAGCRSGVAKKGRNRKRWNGKVNGKRLRPGTYLLTYRSLQGQADHEHVGLDPPPRRQGRQDPPRAPRARRASSSCARSSSVSGRERRASRSQATSTDRPSAATGPSGSTMSCATRHARAPDRLDSQHDRDRAVVAADLVAVVELDAREHEEEAGLDDAEALEQRATALLEQLVVDGLVEVAEEVEVAPAQLDLDADLLSGHRRGMIPGRWHATST